ncbi:hypothetical protein TNCV_2880891 [Trichonephila clavipes]|nr:hypothetical protein TNCV_2880891 [Trichonephila clavipes]
MRSRVSRQKRNGIQKCEIVSPDNPDQDNETKLLNYCIVIDLGQQNMSEPIFEEEIPTSYGKDIDKVDLHIDKASSHMFGSTATCLAKKEQE